MELNCFRNQRDRTLLVFKKILSDRDEVKIVRVNQRLEESGQLLENVDQTHLVLAIDKLVIQKGI